MEQSVWMDCTLRTDNTFIIVGRSTKSRRVDPLARTLCVNVTVEGPKPKECRALQRNASPSCLWEMPHILVDPDKGVTPPYTLYFPISFVLCVSPWRHWHILGLCLPASRTLLCCIYYNSTCGVALPFGEKGRPFNELIFIQSLSFWIYLPEVGAYIYFDMILHLIHIRSQGFFNIRSMD